MSNKTISINPLLFNNSLKTKKKRETLKPKNNIQIISPNVIKNKLLKRIKEHKQKETQNLENNKLKLNNSSLNNNNNSLNQKDKEISNFNDEFNDSINYLQTLSKQNKIDNEKNSFEFLQQKRKEELERKTVKNHSSIQQPMVNIDLPEELIYHPIINTDNSYKINTSLKSDNIPYGILKNGLKPTFKTWNKSQKNMSMNPSPNPVIEITPVEIEIPKEVKMDPPAQVMIEPLNEPMNEDRVEKHPVKVGKSKKNRTVQIWIACHKTRKQKEENHDAIRKTNLTTVKNYLKNHRLIKVGSTAPTNLIRQIYENAKLYGDVTNENKQNLLYNFEKDTKESE